jgi:hypothetical protein
MAAPTAALEASQPSRVVFVASRLEKGKAPELQALMKAGFGDLGEQDGSPPFAGVLMIYVASTHS